MEEEYEKTIKRADQAAEDGRIEESFNFYKKAVTLEPKRVEAYYNIALLYHQQNQLNDAIANFEKAAELNPNDASVFNNLGVSYYSKEMLDEAEANFKKAVAVQPNYTEALHGLEKVYQKQGKTKAIFIGGTGRSGTTLLQKLLDIHKDIAVFNETKLIGQPLFRDFPRRFNKYPSGKRKEILSEFEQIWLTEWYKFKISSPTNPSDDGWRGLYQWFDRDEIKDSLLDIMVQFEDTNSEEVLYSIYGMFLDNLFTKYATKQDKKYWAEKTPANSVYAPFLAKCFDNLKLINVIRDGRDAACSLLKVPWGPDEPKKALDWWAFHLTKALKAQKKLPQNSFLNVRYEDIVLKTEPTLHRIIDFLGVDWDDNLLSFEIYKGSVGRYKNDLDSQAQQYAQDKYGKLLSMLGYLIEKAKG